MLDEELEFAEDGKDHPTESALSVIKETATFDDKSFNESDEIKNIHKIEEDVQKDFKEVDSLKERLKNAEKTLEDHKSLLSKK